MSWGLTFLSPLSEESEEEAASERAAEEGRGSKRGSSSGTLRQQRRPPSRSFSDLMAPSQGGLGAGGLTVPEHHPLHRTNSQEQGRVAGFPGEQINLLVHRVTRFATILLHKKTTL